MSKDKTAGPSMENILKRMAELEATQATLQLKIDDRDKKILELEAKTEAAGEAAMTMLGRSVSERFIGKKKVNVKT
jgi:prefoldin subunit 5